MRRKVLQSKQATRHVQLRRRDRDIAFALPPAPHGGSLSSAHDPFLVGERDALGGSSTITLGVKRLGSRGGRTPAKACDGCRDALRNIQVLAMPRDIGSMFNDVKLLSAWFYLNHQQSPFEKEEKKL